MPQKALKSIYVTSKILRNFLAPVKKPCKEACFLNNILSDRKILHITQIRIIPYNTSPMLKGSQPNKYRKKRLNAG